MPTNILRGAKVRLTALNKEDASVMVRWSEDAEYLRLQDTNLALPRTEAQLAADIEKQNEASDIIVFAVRVVETDDLIGFVGFWEIEWANRAAWLGIGIGDRAYWSHGYGTGAMELALKYAFDEMNLHRVQLTVLDYNERAIALYEKLGFRREGTYREFGLREGERYDMYLYGLLRPEWESQRA